MGGRGGISGAGEGLLVVGNGQARITDSMILVEDDEMGFGANHYLEQDSPDWDCALCLYGEVSHRQLICRNCSQEVHVYTADLEEFPFVNWYCPGCLSSQISYLNQQSLTRRRRAVNSRRGRGRTRLPGSGSAGSGSLVGSSRRVPSSAVSGSLQISSTNGRTGRQLRGVGSASSRILGASSWGASSSLQQPLQSSPVEVERSVPRPQISAEEREAWEMFEQARSLEEGSDDNMMVDQGMSMGSSNSNSDGLVSSTSSSSAGNEIVTSASPPQSEQPKKLKRPCRRANPPRANISSANVNNSTPPITASSSSKNADISPTDPPLQHVAPTVSSEITPSSPSEPQTLVQSLLSNIRSSSPKIITNSGESSSPSHPRPTPLMSPPSTTATTPAITHTYSSVHSPSPISTMSPSPSSTSDNESDSSFMVTSVPTIRSMSNVTTDTTDATTTGANTTSSNSSDPELSLTKKLQVQNIVRDVLRPVYRSGRINKDQYTQINKRVSRALYEQLLKDSIIQGEENKRHELRIDTNNPLATPKWRELVEDYVNKELETMGEGSS